MHAEGTLPRDLVLELLLWIRIIVLSSLPRIRNQLMIFKRTKAIQIFLKAECYSRPMVIIDVFFWTNLDWLDPDTKNKLYNEAITVQTAKFHCA